MVRNIIINCTLLLAALAGSTIFYSCKDDVFNPEKVRATYQDKFSVKEINSIMDYSIRNFDKNSLIEKSSIVSEFQQKTHLVYRKQTIT